MTPDSASDAPASRVTLGCFVFALPDPLPFPDGTQVAEPVANSPHSPTEPDDPLVSLTFHQVTSSFGRTRGTFEAVNEVIARLPYLPKAEARSVPDNAMDHMPAASYTVVTAVTEMESPDDLDDAWDGNPGDLPPRLDAFNRCVRLVGDLARAYRISAGVPYGLPSYERIATGVLLYTAPARRRRLDPACAGCAPGSGCAEVIEATGPFDGLKLMFLDHLNLPDIAEGPQVNPTADAPFTHWMRMLRLGSPFLTWRERLVEAERALHIQGDYAQAVVLAQTAAEVFLDTLLMLMLWEERAGADAAAALLEEGRLTRRIKTEWAPRLGGNWALDGPGPVADWFQRTAVLRNRVVHGGYEPSRPEAAAAFQAVFPLETFAYDRLVERRNRYPRAVLMTVAESGLTRRGLWSGTIKVFAASTAKTEPNWELSFRDFRDAVAAARAAI